MKIQPKLVLILFLSLLTQNVFSQPKNDFIISQDFVPFLDSLIAPPVNCDAAWTLVITDSLNNKYVLISAIEEQDTKIQKIISEITTNLNLKKIKINAAPPSGKGPSENIPPGNTSPSIGGKISDDFRDIQEDFQDANLAITRITETKEEFKDEINDMQYKVNEKLHNTHETDYDAHITIINDFMLYTEKQYQKHKLVFRENMNKIDAIIKKYDYGFNIKSPRIKSEILKYQLSQSENLKFLSNITKEFTVIGANFYKEKYINSHN
ncbi:MAG: hypothetical protein ABI792_04990 [bacterium]